MILPRSSSSTVTKVSSTLPGGDVRGYYQALGIELPAWAQREASVVCFADPDAHAHGDRDPSCSVNVEAGAWHCWGCGAKGGAYDAALASGRSPREAMDLLIAYGLAERRMRARARSTSAPTAEHPVEQRVRSSARPRRRELAIGEPELAEARARLGALRWPPRVLRAEQARVWSRAVLLKLGCGFAGGRLLSPSRTREASCAASCATPQAMTTRPRCSRWPARGSG